MAQYRVWNKHPHGLTHKEKFREGMVEIPANGYVLMDYEDATLFKGQFFPMMRDNMGQQTPESMKCISIEPHDGAELETKPMKFVCQFDGKTFGSASELAAYEKGLAASHSEMIVKDEVAEAELSKKKAGKKTA